MMKRTSKMVAGLLCALAVMPMSVAFGAEAETVDRTQPEEWERAAVNRNWAAVTQFNQAKRLIALAQELRSQDHKDEAERRRNMKAAGASERQAGDLFGKAVGNFEKAADNWGKVARLYARAKDALKQTDALEMKTLAIQKSVEACGAAASAYEMAADSYGERGANDPDTVAAVSEQAAVWREKLASR